MRILILTGSYAPETGGIAAYVHGFARGLLTHGIRVSIVAATSGASEFSSPELPVLEFDLPARGYIRRVRACRNAVSRALAAEKPDRVVASSWSPYAVGLPRSHHIDILCHGLDLLEPIRSLRYRLILRRTLASAATVIANSRFTADLALRTGASPGRTLVVRPGIDALRFQPGPRNLEIVAKLGSAPESPILLSVGRLVQRKGFDRVIEALPEILREFGPVSYWIIGAGPDLARLEKLANDLGVAGHVRFLGYVPDEELPRYYHTAHIFLMPSRHLMDERDAEGFGIVYLEAACCGLPVIGGRSGGVEDAVIDGRTGLLVDPESSQALTLAVLKLLRDSALREALGRAGRERAVAEFAWPKVLEPYISRLT
jgi:phosphatidylinositol alpha-1,6-mannosyltransferase